MSEEKTKTEENEDEVVKVFQRIRKRKAENRAKYPLTGLGSEDGTLYDASQLLIIEADIKDMVKSMSHHVEHTRRLMSEWLVRSTQRSSIVLSSQVSEDVKYSKNTLTFLNASNELRIEFTPEKAKQLARKILSEI